MAENKTVTIAGFQFELKQPYDEGHVLTTSEAGVLNQTYLENIRNNVANRIKTAKEAAEAAGTEFSLDTPIGGDSEDAAKTLRQVVSDYADSYEFGVRSTRTAEPVDPVQREARVIARDTLNSKLKAAGTKRKDISDEAYEGAIAALAARDDVQKEAQRRVNNRSKIGSDEIDLGALGLGGDPTPVETETPAS